MSLTKRVLSGKVALITGASQGIGAAIAKAYAEAGAHVILVARNQAVLERLDDNIQSAGLEPATLVPLDLRQHDKIDQLAMAIYERFGALDILVGCAAQLGTLTPVSQMDPKEFEQVLQLNLTTNARFLRACDPLLRKAKAGRAIFVGDSITHEPTSYWGAYAISKAALEYMVRTYGREVRNTDIRAYLVDPGPVRTQLRAQAFPGENPKYLPAPESVAPFFVKLAAGRFKSIRVRQSVTEQEES